MSLKIGISGKRQIPPAERERVKAEIHAVIEKLKEKHKTDTFTGYTSLASGADTLFADVVKNEFHQPLHIILPFALQEFKKDFDNEKDTKKLESYITEYDIKQIVTPTIPVNKEERNLAYFNGGKAMADQCNEMIFVWDELKPNGQGGTAEIIGYYAEKKQNAKIEYIKVKPSIPDSFNDKIFKEYNQLNEHAMDNRDNYKMAWKSVIILGWFAVLCFAINVSCPGMVSSDFLLTAIETALVVLVSVIILVAKTNHYHRHYLKSRMRAEVLRLLICFYHADMQVIISKETSENDKTITGIANTINQNFDPAVYKSKWYIQYVIKNLIEEQIDYHTSKIKKIGNKHTIHENIRITIGFLFLINIVLHFFSEFIEHFSLDICFNYPQYLTIFLTIILPATSAAIEGFLFFNEWVNLKQYSTTAKESLKICLNDLPKDIDTLDDTDCYKKQSNILNLVSSTMLTDNKNWEYILEDKESYHMVV